MNSLSGPRLGVDIGGTFTDFVLIDDSTGTIRVEKCLTTPAAPEQGIYNGIARMEEHGAQVRAEIVHATTLITNAIIEAKGAKTGLITTKGFRDILEIGRETRYYVYDLDLQFPTPIVPRQLRREVRERTLTDGSVTTPLNEDDIARVIADFNREGVSAVAIMFLHSYRNPANELAARRIIERLAPELKVSLSHEVVAQPREYERLSTTVLDAYVKPITARYMDDLQRHLKATGHAKSLAMMLSNGGILPIDVVKKFPIQLVESGPAAGVEAATYFGQMLDLNRLLAFDMGGTTAKLCLIRDGKASLTREFEVAHVHRFQRGSGYPLALQVYNLLEIGAGGGSIARINNLGLLTVGPESASSEPGPACYGRGGVEPTVTDADLVLGFLDQNSFLGGEFVLDADAARSSIERALASPLATSCENAAWGIFDLVTETMASAARLHLAEKGEDPTRCALFASGGAGPVHAVALARRLECPLVVIPPLPGVMSAFGLLAARPAFDLSRAVRIPLKLPELGDVERYFAALESEAMQLGQIEKPARIERFVELRHRGQDSAIEVDGSGDWNDANVGKRAAAAFGDEYLRLYGRRGDDTPLEISTLRVVVSQDRNLSSMPPPAPARNLARRVRPVWFEARRHDAVPVIPRHSLVPGDRIPGPAIIEERESTTVVWPGDEAVVHPSLALLIHIAAK